MNNHKRRSYRPRQQKNGFRRRNNSSSQNHNGHFVTNGNNNFNRNPSMTNPFSVEKTIQKFKQLAKDAQSSGDPVLVENYLQHADHYSRRLAELNSKSQEASQSNDKSKISNNSDIVNVEKPEGNN
tara:strand:- start:1603 stop:1980 length:378 start_codon:yes stop_codon:yes gene_type:complete